MTLRVSVLLAYALPAIALAALYLPLYTYVSPFYAAERGVDLAALGLTWIVIRLFDAVSDPAMGWISDRTPVGWGRRRLWLGISVPLICVGTWQVFVPPEGAGIGHAALWLFLLTLGWTMAQTPYAAWGAELAPDYKGRTRVTSWREAMVLVGTIGTALVYVSGGSGGDGLRAVAVSIVVLLPLTVCVALLAVPDRSDMPPPRLGFADGWRAMAGNEPFRKLLVAWFVNGLANGFPVTLFLFFTGDRLGLDADTAGLMFILYFGSAIIGIPGWSWAAGRIGKHKAWCAAMIYACAIFATVLLLDHGDVWGFAAISVLTGLALGADLALPPSIQADVVELDTQRTGAARAGLFFAVWQVATKAALAVSSGLALIALGWVGFQAGAENSSEALWALTLLYAAAPITMKLLAVVLMWRFPLDEATVERRAVC